MRTKKFEILRENIVSGSLVSLNSQNWYDRDGSLVPWSGSVYIGPNQGDVIYNTNTGSFSEGYYKWSGTTWSNITKPQAYGDNQLPLFLEVDLDEMGVMVEFDGEIEQVEQLCNFTYVGSSNTITVYNTGSTNRLKKLVDANFTVDWGDGSISGVTLLSNVSHTYTTTGEKIIKLTMDSPWSVENVQKIVHIPLTSGYTGSNPLGTLTFNVPYTSITGVTLDYINDYDSNTTGYTGTTMFTAIGTSRVDELRLYGSTNAYSGVTTGTTTMDGETYTYSGYTLDNLSYLDLSDGTTLITGNTSNYDPEFVINTMLTRNEHFLGFITDPIIYSDVFVERGKQGVTEYNLRLGEIDNLGELDVYGNGYFKVRKQ